MDPQVKAFMDSVGEVKDLKPIMDKIKMFAGLAAVVLGTLQTDKELQMTLPLLKAQFKDIAVPLINEIRTFEMVDNLTRTKYISEALNVTTYEAAMILAAWKRPAPNIAAVTQQMAASYKK